MGALALAILFAPGEHRVASILAVLIVVLALVLMLDEREARRSALRDHRLRGLLRNLDLRLTGFELAAREAAADAFREWTAGQQELVRVVEDADRRLKAVERQVDDVYEWVQVQTAREALIRDALRSESVRMLGTRIESTDESVTTK